MTATASVRTPSLQHDKMMKERFGTEVSPNGKLERRIVANLVAHLENAGFEVVSVFDGETTEPCTTAKGAMEFIFNLDEASLKMRKVGTRITHSISLVVGNGIDIISDYSYAANDPDGFNAAMESFNAEQFA